MDCDIWWLLPFVAGFVLGCITLTVFDVLGHSNLKRRD